MKILMVLMVLLSTTAFAQTSTETQIADGDYFCEENDTSGVHFKVNFNTVNQAQVLTMTEIIPYGGYVCTWFCDDMTANEVPYVLGFFRITPSNDGTGDVMSSYGRMTVAGVRQLATFFVSANGINAIFKRMVGTHFALVQTKCNLIP